MSDGVTIVFIPVLCTPVVPGHPVTSDQPLHQMTPAPHLWLQEITPTLHACTTRAIDFKL